MLFSSARYWSAAELDESNVLHFYIARNHPNPVEALVYLWFRTQTQFDHRVCVLLEGLVAARQYRALASKFMSDRVYRQLAQSSFRELAFMVQGTHSKLAAIRQQVTPHGLCSAVSTLATEVRQLAEYRLTDEIDYWLEKEQATLRSLRTDIKLHAGTESSSASQQSESEATGTEGSDKGKHADEDGCGAAGGGNKTDLRSMLVTLVHKSFWRSAERRLVETMSCVVAVGCATNSVHTAAGTLLLDVVTAEARNVSLDELALTVRDTNPYLVRERDLVTIYNEFRGLTEEDTQRLFRLSKFDLGELIYKKLRKQMLIENPPAESFEEEKLFYERTRGEAHSPKLWLKKYFDGLFFLLPLLINFVCSVWLGWGYYGNRYIKQEQVPFVNAALMLAFIISGGYVQVIGRLCSLYVSQWTFAVSSLWALRVLIAGMMGPLLVSIGVVAAFRGSIPSLIFAGYLLSLTFSLLLMAVLFAHHTGSIWKAREGHAILLALGVQLAIVGGVYYAADLPKRTATSAFVHFGAQLVADAILVAALIFLLYKRSRFMAHIKLPKERNILAWYCRQIGTDPPPIWHGEEALKAWAALRVPPADENSPIPQPDLLTEGKRAAQKILSDAWIEYSRVVNAHLSMSFWRRWFVPTPEKIVNKRVRNYHNEVNFHFLVKVHPLFLTCYVL